MLAGRVAALLVLALAAVVVPLDGVTAGDRRLAVLACAAAIAVHLGLGVLGDRARAHLLTVVDVALVVDAALVVALALLSGGHDSPAVWLLPLVALAATLGLSAANGVKALALAGIAVGTVHLASGAEAPTLDEHADLLAFSAATVAVAAGLAWVNERELRRRRERAETMNAASLAFEAAHGADALVDAAVAAARELMPGWEVAIRRDGEPAADGLWREDGRVRLEVPVTAGRSAGTAAGDDGEPETLAVVSLVRPAPPRGFLRVRGQEIASVRTLARTLGVALSRAALVEQLARLSATDHLTGLANRRVFDRDLAAELARARRSGDPVGLALIDVDHFKRFNDAHGHRAGDEALVALAGTLAASARTEDRPCRFGGEEFALILPGAGVAEAVEVGERVRRAVERITLPYGPLTVSIGVATSDGTDAPEALVEAADRCLYRAKDGGRNRVVAPAAAAG